MAEHKDETPADVVETVEPIESAEPVEDPDQTWVTVIETGPDWLETGRERITTDEFRRRGL